MNKEFKEYLNTPPEIVFEWNDAETGAQGWIVINSLRNGAAGGGTRMREGLTREEVLSLAKVMEIKFSVSGPPIGGAKSGINFDPSDPRRKEVLKKWFKAVSPILKNYYGTGGDLNVDEILDVIPLTEDTGLWHPQEGVVNGHFKQASEGEKVKMLGQLRVGCSKKITDYNYIPKGGEQLTVADMITGYGVAESVKHYYDLFAKPNLKGKRTIIQGWGNVAAAAAYYLARMGANIVGIIDAAGGIIEPQGMSFERVEQLYLNKKGNKLHDDAMVPFERANEAIWDAGAEIFIPGAASKLLTRDQVDRMIAKGLEVISCGANVPFIDDGISFGPTAEFTDGQVALIPDFIANCGMARAFAYLMQADANMSDKAIFVDTSDTIKRALAEVRQETSSGKNLSKTALSIALKKLK